MVPLKCRSWSGRCKNIGNRSSLRRQEGMNRHVGSVIMDGFDQEVKDVSALQTQGLRDSKPALDEPAAGSAVAAERDLPPQHATAEDEIGVIVRRLDSLRDDETPQRRLQIHQVAAKVSRLAIGARPPSVEHLAQVSRDRIESLLQAGARQPSAAEKVPRLEDFTDNSQAFCAYERARTAAIGALLEVALEMGPTDLPQQH